MDVPLHRNLQKTSVTSYNSCLFNSRKKKFPGIGRDSFRDTADVNLWRTVELYDSLNDLNPYKCVLASYLLLLYVRLCEHLAKIAILYNIIHVSMVCLS